jgi:hypothetical protein
VYVEFHVLNDVDSPRIGGIGSQTIIRNSIVLPFGTSGLKEVYDEVMEG